MKKRGEVSNGLPLVPSGGGDVEPRPAHELDAASELELIDTAQQGDMQAFTNLFQHYRPDLYGYCFRRLEDPSLAEDVVQESFIKALTGLPSFDREKRVWPWLATIAFRLCTDIQRDRSRTFYSGNIALTVDAGYKHESVLDSLIASEGRSQLMKSLRALPKRQRRALQLYALDGLSYEDIAAAEGISVGAVKLLLVRARRKMRDARRGENLPAIVFPITWLRWKAQQIEERIRPLLSVHGEGWSAACVQAACLSTVAMMVIAVGQPAANLQREVPTRSAEAVASAQFGTLQTSLLPAALSKTGVPAKIPAESQQSDADSSSFLVDDVVNPNENASPESTYFRDVTVSPNYESDHTVLALGRYVTSAGTTNYVLFVSTDGGGTWKPRPSRFLQDGVELLLPPGFPGDGRLFAFGGMGLQQSDDGGEIFRTVSLHPGAYGNRAALSPSFGNGESKILMGGAQIFEFDASTGITSPAGLVLPVQRVGEAYSDIAFHPDYPSDSTIFILGLQVPYRCDAIFCKSLDISYIGTPRFKAALGCRQDSTYIRLPYHQPLVFLDTARTLGKVAFPFDDQDLLSDKRSIGDLAIFCNEETDRAIFVSVNADPKRSKIPPSVYRSLDNGISWSRSSVDLPGFGYGAFTLTATPTGRLIATGSAFGIACSVNLGQTWAPRCPPE